MNDNKLDSIVDGRFTINTDDLYDLTLTPGDGVIISYDGGGTSWGITASYAPPTTLDFYDSQGEQALSIDFSSGDVKIAERLTADDASRLFWDRVLENNPLQSVPVPSNVTFECTLPVPNARGSQVTELPKSPEQIALEAYTRAMKVVG